MTQGNLKRHWEMTACRDLCKVQKLKKNKRGCDKLDSVSTGSRTDVKSFARWVRVIETFVLAVNCVCHTWVFVVIMRLLVMLLV